MRNDTPLTQPTKEGIDINNVNTPIGMSRNATASRIEEDYSGSSPYQHLVELVRNATQQPGTTDVIIDIVKMPGSGALKRAVINNGPALTDAQMRTYMTTIGEGSGELWRLHNTLGNRHAGARSALLPWTDLLVLSWDSASLPGGLQIVLSKNLSTGEYEHSEIAPPDAKTLSLLAGNAAVRRSGHGVAFVYLGRDHAVDGPFADESKKETPGGAADAMRDRIFEAVGVQGHPISIKVNYPMPAGTRGGEGGRKMTAASGDAIRLDGRLVRGHAEWTSRPGQNGRVVVDPSLGVKVHWWLLPYDSDPSDRRLPFGGKGHIVLRYKNESMPLAAPGAGYGDLARIMRAWGVHLAEVFNRLALVIECPTDPGPDPDHQQLHVHQTPARSGLIMSDGSPLPLDQWAQGFIDQMPAAIIEANRAARERIVERPTVKFSTGDRLKQRLESRLKLLIQSRRRRDGSGLSGRGGVPGTDYLDGMLPSEDVQPEGSPSEAGVPGMTPGGSKPGTRSKRKGAKRNGSVDPTGKSGRKELAPSAEAAVDVKPAPSPVPEPVPYESQQWIEQDRDPNHFAYWDRAGGSVGFNLGHAIFHAQIAYFGGEWLQSHARHARRITTEEVIEVVREVYFAETIARIMHYAAQVGVHQASLDLNEKTLTIAAHGFENVQAAVEAELDRRSRGGVVVGGSSQAA